jgi:hypothetical protein
MFHAGHAMELYLKAVYLKHQPGMNITKLGHRIGDMINTLKQDHPGFLPSVTLRSGVSTKFLSGRFAPLGDVLNDPDYAHFVEHQELYWVSQYLADLKYLGTVHMSLPSAFGIVCRSVNPYWACLYGEVRTHLGWPIQGAWIDAIRNFQEQHDVSAPMKEFFRNLGA